MFVVHNRLTSEQHRASSDAGSKSVEDINIFEKKNSSKTNVHLYERGLGSNYQALRLMYIDVDNKIVLQ